MRVRNAKGQSLVEFALVLPLLLILVFGIIDFSVGLYDKAVVTNASREGARAGVVYRFPALTAGQLQTEVTTVVNNYCSAHLVTFGASASPTTTATLELVGTERRLRVTVRYAYSFAVIPNFIPGITNPTLTSVSVMRME
jgi:Flp pilus assembly protein TadG